MSQHFGKYRGKVTRVDDPLNLGRLMVTAPSVLGRGNAVWALPCTPYAGPGVGLVLTPPIGANVWVEFEGGQIDAPIWTGGFWARGEFPRAPKSQAVVVLKTPSMELACDEAGGGGVSLVLGAPASSVPMALKARDGAVSLAVKDVKLRISPSEVVAEVGGSKLTLRSGVALLQQGSAKVTLSNGSVSVNDGELVVR